MAIFRQIDRFWNQNNCIWNQYSKLQNQSTLTYQMNAFILSESPLFGLFSLYLVHLFTTFFLSDCSCMRKKRHQTDWWYVIHRVMLAAKGGGGGGDCSGGRRAAEPRWQETSKPRFYYPRLLTFFHNLIKRNANICRYKKEEKDSNSSSKHHILMK